MTGSRLQLSINNLFIPWKKPLPVKYDSLIITTAVILGFLHAFLIGLIWIGYMFLISFISTMTYKKTVSTDWPDGIMLTGSSGASWIGEALKLSYFLLFLKRIEHCNDLIELSQLVYWSWLILGMVFEFEVVKFITSSCAFSTLERVYIC